MKLFLGFFLISGTCFASTTAKVLPQTPTECASLRNLKGTKINCPQNIKTPNHIEEFSDLEMAAIEDEMGPPPEALPEGEELILE